MKDDIELSIIAPAFNEEDSIPVFYRELTAVLRKINKRYEIIFIDDGSSDRTFELLKEIKQKDESLKIIRLTRNFGQHSAITAGLNIAMGKFIITIDADMQNDPIDISQIVKKLEEGFEAVCGYREARKDSFLRLIPSKIINEIIARITGVRLKDYGCMLRGYHRSVVEQIKECGERTAPFNVLINWFGVSICEINVSHSKRLSGRSKYSLLKLLKVNFDIIANFTIFPIQMISLTGAVISLFSIIAGLLLLFFMIAADLEQAGLVFFGLLLSLFSGLILFSIGIVGEYVARIYVSMRRREDYIIKDIIE